MRALILAALVVAILAPSAVSASKPKGCHNITGTCLDHGFVCANDEVVPHSQRCNGVEDCADGTDEFMCHHENDTPMHLRSDEDRHATQQASCVKCTCVASVLQITKGQPWFQYANKAPTDFAGLMTGTGAYRGMPCNPVCAFTIKMAFYKKSGVCRGWLCCARQRECTTCDTTLGGCTTKTPGFTNRCYV